MNEIEDSGRCAICWADACYYHDSFGYLCEECYKKQTDKDKEKECSICGNVYNEEDLKYIFDEAGYVCNDCAVYEKSVYDGKLVLVRCPFSMLYCNPHCALYIKCEGEDRGQCSILNIAKGIGVNTYINTQQAQIDNYMAQLNTMSSPFTMSSPVHYPLKNSCWNEDEE